MGKRTLKEARSRKGMRGRNIWLPVAMDKALAAARRRDRISVNQAIREAVGAWLARRKARRQRAGRQR